MGERGRGAHAIKKFGSEIGLEDSAIWGGGKKNRERARGPGKGRETA